MFTGKVRAIIGMTTFNSECLSLSVPPISRLPQDFLLIIYNTNPSHSITVRDIRKLGYRGRLRIVNSTQDIDLMSARLGVLDVAHRFAPNAQWIVFINDTDMLLDLRIPDVSSNNFAVIQNAAYVNDNLLDVLRLMRSVDLHTLDGVDAEFFRPHIGMAGTMVRMFSAHKMAEILRRVHETISKACVDAASVDAVMWAVLNSIMRGDDIINTPIYMDSVNLVRITPRGRGRDISEKTTRLVADCLAIVDAVMTSEN